MNQKIRAKIFSKKTKKIKLIFLRNNLYNKCVVADLEPQLQAFCRKTWNCRDFLESKKETESGKDNERVRKIKRESDKDREREREKEKDKKRE
jgi:hypothetical protein